MGALDSIAGVGLMSSESKGCVASPLTIIAGMCVIEGEEIFLDVGRELKSICDDLGFDFVLKGEPAFSW